MISRLTVQNFAIIDHLDLEFPDGFVAITGETGAGKSMLLDAISLCLGGRASTELIRLGEEKAILEMFLRLSEEQRSRIQSILDELDIDLEVELHIKRIVAANGRHRIYLNGQRVPLSVLTTISCGLVDIIRQHASHGLLSLDSHITLLDHYSGIGSDTKRLSEKVSNLRVLQQEVRILESQEETRQLTINRLQNQIDEIDLAQIEMNEDELLTKEIDLLLNAEVLRENAQEVVHRMSGGDGALLEQLNSCIQALQPVSHLDDQFEAMLDVLNRTNIELGEMSRDLVHIADSVQVSSEDLEIMQERLYLLERLKRTFGGDLSTVVLARDQLQLELEHLLNQQSRIDVARAEMLTLQQYCMIESNRLSIIRREAAGDMAALVEEELSHLGMPHCKFKVHFSYVNASGVVHSIDDSSIEGLTTKGLDVVEYLISPNPGEGFQPLVKIASGGELSRILLSLKVALIHSDPVGSYIFDEIDSGIGGAVAETVGQKLQQVGEGRQVLCISHLPQVISCAHHHLHVQKTVVENRTSSTISYLDMHQRTLEIARMLGGSEITSRTVEHAQEMLSFNQPKIAYINPVRSA